MMICNNFDTVIYCIDNFINIFIFTIIYINIKLVLSIIFHKCIDFI